MRVRLRRQNNLKVQSLQKLSHWVCSIVLLAATMFTPVRMYQPLMFYLLFHSPMDLVVKNYRSHTKLANPNSQMAFNVSMVAPSLHSSTIQKHVEQDIAMVTFVLCWLVVLSVR